MRISTYNTTTTMSIAVPERMRHHAVHNALGFRRHELFAFILAESFGLSAVGLLLGAGGAWLISANIDAPTLTGGLFPLLTVTPRILGSAALVAVLLGIVSSLAPALSVARMSVVGGLKTLD